MGRLKLCGVLGITLLLGFSGCDDNNDEPQPSNGGSAGSAGAGSAGAGSAGAGSGGTGGSGSSSGGSISSGGSVQASGGFAGTTGTDGVVGGAGGGAGDGGSSAGGSGTGAGGGVSDGPCRYWIASVGQEVAAAMDEGRVVIATEAGVLVNDSERWVVAREETNVFAVTAGDDWFALAVRGEPGEPDYLLYRGGSAEWQQVFAPEVLGRRWTTIAGDGGGLYVWSENGIIASFDGEHWQELTTMAGRGSLAVAGTRLFVWQRDIAELHVWDGGTWEHLVEAEGPAIVGDASHVYIPTHTTTQRTWEFARWTEEGLVPMVEPPDGVHTAVARDSQFAIMTAGDPGYGFYLLNDDEWRQVATEDDVFVFPVAVDSDGTLLVGSRSTPTLELFRPDGARTPVELGAAPQGPLVGDSLESLWTLSTSGALLRLEGDVWGTVAGGAEVRLTQIAASPGGDIFVADQQRVYQWVDDALAPLGDRQFEEIIGLDAASDSELFLVSRTADDYAEFHAWRGTEWEHREDLDFRLSGPTDSNILYSPGRFLALGAGRLLFMVTGISAPDADPVLFWSVFTNSEDGWSSIAGSGEYESDGLMLHGFGPASSPGAIVLTTFRQELPDAYEVFDADAQSIGSGVLDRTFDMNVTGVDLEHMVGVSEGQLLVRNGSAAWHEVTTLSPLAVRAPFALGVPWMGTGAVGYANRGGTTICTYDW